MYCEADCIFRSNDEESRFLKFFKATIKVEGVLELKKLNANRKIT